MKNLQYINIEEIRDQPDLIDFIIDTKRKFRLPYLDMDWSHVPREGARKGLLRGSTHSTHKDYWIIMDQEKPIGWLFFHFKKLTDTHVLSADVHLLEEYQKQGYGKSSIVFGIKHFMDQKELFSQFTRFHLDTNSVNTPARIFSFLEEKGYKVNYNSRTSGADLTQYDRKEIKNKADDLLRIAQLKGYTFQYFFDGDFSELRCDLKDFFEMREAIWNDMPSEDADWEYEVYDEKMHEESYKYVQDGDHALTLICYDNDDNPVGITESWMDGDINSVLRQNDTGVIKEHRGKNLGRTLKYNLINYVFSNYPESDKLQYWITENAASNEHMIRINNELKYEELLIEQCHEIDLDKALSHFGISKED